MHVADVQPLGLLLITAGALSTRSRHRHAGKPRETTSARCATRLRGRQPLQLLQQCIELSVHRHGENHATSNRKNC